MRVSTHWSGVGGAGRGKPGAAPVPGAKDAARAARMAARSSRQAGRF